MIHPKQNRKLFHFFGIFSGKLMDLLVDPMYTAQHTYSTTTQCVNKSGDAEKKRLIQIVCMLNGTNQQQQPQQKTARRLFACVFFVAVVVSNAIYINVLKI